MTLANSATLLANRYRLMKQLAVGGASEVYEALDTRLDRTVAVKVLVGHDDPLEIERFRQEAALLAALDHPHLMPLLDSNSNFDGADRYIAMPLVSGGTLADRLRSGPLHPLETMRIGAAVADALAHLHVRGIIHRDVKPANILYDQNGCIFLTDLGIADAAGRTLSTARDCVVGTAGYFAPEQVTGDAVPATDVFALGITLLETLTGRPQYVGTPMERVAAAVNRPPQIPKEIGPEWHALLTALTRRTPDYRPPAATVVQWLRAVPELPGRPRISAASVPLPRRTPADSEPAAPRRSLRGRGPAAFSTPGPAAG